ncbi:hypothetical protein LTR10_018645 [Elasticomyces elasticus]|uniref:DUF3429 domain-containing protein n=1 Tax=Exophiala sideris TaxID=1016849 RepID=A0ABR0JSB5_9EURO|nr:hypothetical protein LTR10_018645 [Elasticomyces elasticus]KAK5040390.1 hypothetical protein LTS07_000888 [Exophiala sideris]KAK5043183.1 hypothetical protein LTR13_000954 [Exophiala sideris]KAK5068768.1 hypothetical protein LTR69_000889 [Exophiala sideris]KAK5186366.1 hypothetical protein LTR44_001422 [Eurotiomycetes sp. CCFEE 6388]
MSATMFRTTAVRSIPRSFASVQAPKSRMNLYNHVLKASLRTSARPAKATRVLSLTVARPFHTSLVRYESKAGLEAAQYDIKKAEKTLGEQTLKPVPDAVSLSSSTRAAASEMTSDHDDDVDMMAGIRSDFTTIVDTFSLRDVPRRALYVGLAGVVPYLATSLTTVYLSFDIQYAATHGQGFLMSGETAEALLHIIEPIQLGYGASIISFLGAIHWGLEWAGFGGEKGYPRYSMGIIATAVAWPTLLLNAEMGLITQFLAFTFLYYNDARAAAHGWAPNWYGTYRFVLTFIVGASIVASLIGRGQIADLVTRPPGPADRMRELRKKQMDELEAEPEGDEEEEEDDE